jgi:hypothetical protein
VACQVLTRRTAERYAADGVLTRVDSVNTPPGYTRAIRPFGRGLSASYWPAITASTSTRGCPLVPATTIFIVCNVTLDQFRAKTTCLLLLVAE